MALHLQQHDEQPQHQQQQQQDRQQQQQQQQDRQQQQQQQQFAVRTLLLFAPAQGETGLSIKASRDGQFIILTSSIQVSSWGLYNC
jgi:outer membrane biosynthesis protein TonB